MPAIAAARAFVSGQLQPAILAASAAVGHQLAGALLLEREFGVMVDVAAQGNEFAFVRAHGLQGVAGAHPVLRFG